MEQGWAETLIHSEAFQPVAMPAGAEEEKRLA
jgi:vanillate O-demethylase ferredoxin subunit